MDRKLAAILAADVVGYSALMEHDEAGTFERLKALRRIMLEPLVKEHHGRIFKMMGDGFLVEFASVVDAVACAAALQKGLHGHNEQVPEEERIILRIGVNLGDVIVEGKDRHGEGVNIAARLEQLAEPGGICVSQPVIDQLSNKLPLVFDDIGEHRVKNIEKPIHAYRAKLEGMPVKRRQFPTARSGLPLMAAVVAGLAVMAGGAAFWFNKATPPTVTAATPRPVVADDRPSLVVLPFDNLSDDKEQGYLADGLTEDLTTELARVPGLFVISRNAAFTYKGKAVQPAQIAKELGVRYILEGSTRRAGEDMRLNAQLIDAETGGHVWAERFDGQWADVFALQDKLVGSIAGALKLRLVTSHGKADVAGGTDNPDAYEAYLRGLQLQDSGSPGDWAEAVGNFKQALALDPVFGMAAAKLGWMYVSAQSVKSKQQALGLSGEQARAAKRTFFEVAARNPSATYYQWLADDLLYRQKSDEAIAAAQKSIALDPSDGWGYEEMSLALTFNGRPADGREYLDAALRVDPKWTPWRYLMAGLAEFSLGRFAEAAALLEKLDQAQQVSSYWDFWAKYNGLRLLISTYGHLGRSADAAAVAEKIKPYGADVDDGEFTGVQTMTEFPFKNDADTERLLEGLRKAGVPELPAGLDLKSKDRLSSAEIASLILGHTIEGRELESGDAYLRMTEMDDSVEVKVGSWSDTGVTSIDGQFLCSWFPTSYRNCFAVFRNPVGTADRKNEYLLRGPWNSFEFSVIK
jgi:adenylate cyclase